MNRTLRNLTRTTVGRCLLVPYRARTALLTKMRGTMPLWRWLVSSREWTNYTYEYSPPSAAAAIELVSLASGVPWQQISEYDAELRRDDTLKEHYAGVAGSQRHRNVLDGQMRLARQLIYYLLVRACRPAVVVEAGCDRGLGSLLITTALMRNADEGASGHLHTIDLNEEAGFLLGGAYAKFATFHHASSTQFLSAFEQPIDFFIHDTANEPSHTREQFAALGHALAPGSVVLTTWFGQSFVEFCRAQGLRFLSFAEQPADHWYGGCRLGLAFADSSRTSQQ